MANLKRHAMAVRVPDPPYFSADDDNASSLVDEVRAFVQLRSGTVLERLAENAVELDASADTALSADSEAAEADYRSLYEVQVGLLRSVSLEVRQLAREAFRDADVRSLLGALSRHEVLELGELSGMLHEDSRDVARRLDALMAAGIVDAAGDGVHISYHLAAE